MNPENRGEARGLYLVQLDFYEGRENTRIYWLVFLPPFKILELSEAEDRGFIKFVNTTRMPGKTRWVEDWIVLDPSVKLLKVVITDKGERRVYMHEPAWLKIETREVKE
jgi:hypothetical protein